MSVPFSFRDRLVLLASFLMLSSSSVLGQSGSNSEENEPFYWNNGLWFSRPLFELKIGGQAQLDTAGFPNDQGEFASENGVEWRRAQIYTNIQLGKRMSFKFQWGFQGQLPRLKDAWMQLSFPKLGMFLRGGRFSSTFGLEKGNELERFDVPRREPCVRLRTPYLDGGKKAILSHLPNLRFGVAL